MRAIVSSAVASVSTSGVLETTIPRRVASANVDAVVADSEVRDDAEARPGGVEELGADDVGGDRHEAGRAGDLVREREGRLEAREHRVGHAPREEDLRLHVSRTVMARSGG